MHPTAVETAQLSKRLALELKYSIGLVNTFGGTELE